MKPFALAGIYAASLGAVIYAIEADYVDSPGTLLLVWAAAGLVIVVLGIFRTD